MASGGAREAHCVGFEECGSHPDLRRAECRVAIGFARVGPDAIVHNFNCDVSDKASEQRVLQAIKDCPACLEVFFKRPASPQRRRRQSTNERG